MCEDLNTRTNTWYWFSEHKVLYLPPVFAACQRFGNSATASTPVRINLYTGKTKMKFILFQGNHIFWQNIWLKKQNNFPSLIVMISAGHADVMMVLLTSGLGFFSWDQIKRFESSLSYKQLLGCLHVPAEISLKNIKHTHARTHTLVEASHWQTGGAAHKNPLGKQSQPLALKLTVSVCLRIKAQQILNLLVGISGLDPLDSTLSPRHYRKVSTKVMNANKIKNVTVSSSEGWPGGQIFSKKQH